jgi:hypothetical protein
MTTEGVQILKIVHNRLNEWFKSNTENAYLGLERAMYSLLKRATDTAGAILCLYEGGYYSPAMGLTRLMIELAIDVAIIEANPDKVVFLEEYNKRIMVKLSKVWSERDIKYKDFYKKELSNFEQVVPLERRTGKEAKRWDKDRWGYNLRALTEEVDKTGTLTRIYDVVVRTQQVYLHGGLLPEWSLPENRDVDILIGDNVNYLLDIVEHCRSIFCLRPLPDFQDLTDDLNKRVNACIGSHLR